MNSRRGFRWYTGRRPVCGVKNRAALYAATGKPPPCHCALFAALSAGGFTLEFDEPQWAPTPGQYAVVYDGDVCLGGGVIA